MRAVLVLAGFIYSLGAHAEVQSKDLVGAWKVKEMKCSDGGPNATNSEAAKSYMEAMQMVISFKISESQIKMKIDIVPNGSPCAMVFTSPYSMDSQGLITGTGLDATYAESTCGMEQPAAPAIRWQLQDVSPEGTQISIQDLTPNTNCVNANEILVLERI